MEDARSVEEMLGELNGIVKGVQRKKKVTDADLAGVLLRVKRVAKGVEEMKETELVMWKEGMKEVKDRYREVEQAMEKAEETLKEEMLKVHKGVESITDALGSIVFPMRWVWETENEKEVKREWMGVDAVKVGEAVKKGIRKISGLRIFQKRGVEVRVAAPDAETQK